MSGADMFEQLGREIARRLGPSMDEDVESAIETLEDDGLVAFGLVAIRHSNDGVQARAQRAIDLEVVMDSDHDAETVVDALHETLCNKWDEEVAEQ